MFPDRLVGLFEFDPPGAIDADVPLDTPTTVTIKATNGFTVQITVTVSALGGGEFSFTVNAIQQVGGMMGKTGILLIPSILFTTTLLEARELRRLNRIQTPDQSAALLPTGAVRVARVNRCHGQRWSGSLPISPATGIPATRAAMSPTTSSIAPGW